MRFCEDLLMNVLFSNPNELENEALVLFGRSFEKWLCDWDPLHWDNAATLPFEGLRTLLEMGAGSVNAPESGNGLGGSIRDVCILLDLAARCDASLAVLLADHLGCVQLVNACSGPELQEELFQGLFEAESFWGHGFGNKSGVPPRLCGTGKRGASILHLPLLELTAPKSYFCLAQGSEEAEAALWRIEHFEAPGNGHTQLGLRALRIGDAELATRFSKTDRVGIATLSARETNRAFRLLAIASCALGLAEQAFEKAAHYANHRVQFKKPLSSFEMIQSKLVESECAIFQMESLLFWGLKLFEEEPESAVPLALAAKVISAEAVARVCDHAMQIHGGNGYMEELGIPKLLRDACAFFFLEGTNYELEAQLAEHGLASFEPLLSAQSNKTQGTETKPKGAPFSWRQFVLDHATRIYGEWLGEKGGERGKQAQRFRQLMASKGEI